MTPNFLKAWRRHRGLTQAELAARIGTNASVVSLLEGGQRRLSPHWLRRLAVALQAPVGAFLEYGPDQGRADLLDAWAAVPQSQRAQAAAVLRTFIGRRRRDHTEVQGDPQQCTGL